MSCIFFHAYDLYKFYNIVQYLGSNFLYYRAYKIFKALFREIYYIALKLKNHTYWISNIQKLTNLAQKSFTGLI